MCDDKLVKRVEKLNRELSDSIDTQAMVIGRMLDEIKELRHELYRLTGEYRYIETYSVWGREE